jgi:hypothetical protein
MIGTTVILQGDRYIFLFDADTEATILTTSQLDVDTRTKIGILKVIGDGEAVESVGMRVNSTIFYLLP